MDRQATAPEAPPGPGSTAPPQGADALTSAEVPPPVALVLDTNALLDWWLFEEPVFAALPRALSTGQVRWLACPAMRTELQHVLARRVLARYQPDCERTLAQFDQWVRLCTDPTPLPAPRLRCRDPDDQMFIDLALREGAAWLLTRDRDLLSLARKAQPLGLRIALPETWRDEQGPAPP